MNREQLVEFNNSVKYFRKHIYHLKEQKSQDKEIWDIVKNMLFDLRKLSIDELENITQCDYKFKSNEVHKIQSRAMLVQLLEIEYEVTHGVCFESK